MADATNGARALKWLRRAGPRAAGAVAAARRSSRPATPFSGGVLGLPSPNPDLLLRRARRAAFAEGMLRWFRFASEPLPPSAVIPEPDLYYVVDDDPAAREALAGYLESQGARVVAFGDELSLFCAVARRPPTAILLDVVLNGVDGLRLCEGLKQHPLTRDVPVFVMSGLNRPHVRARALAAGAAAFLPKPIAPERVVALVHQRRIDTGAARGPPGQGPGAEGLAAS
jgi:CheY-like chemotaxis protein